MTKPLVLVVDDNPDWRHDFEAYTRHSGFDVVTAENGAEAIAVIEANHAIVAVVTDTQMYPGDGITVLQFVGGRDTLLPTLILSSAPVYVFRERVVELESFVGEAFGEFAQFALKDGKWVDTLRSFLAEKIPLAP